MKRVARRSWLAGFAAAAFGVLSIVPSNAASAAVAAPVAPMVSTSSSVAAGGFDGRSLPLAAQPTSSAEANVAGRLSSDVVAAVDSVNLRPTAPSASSLRAAADPDWPDWFNPAVACEHDGNGNLIMEKIPDEFRVTSPGLVVLSDDAAYRNHGWFSIGLPYTATNKNNNDPVDAVRGLVPGDCGQITLQVQNAGSRIGLLNVYLMSVELAPPVNDPFYDEFTLKVLRDSSLLSIYGQTDFVKARDLVAGGKAMSESDSLVTTVSTCADKNCTTKKDVLARRIDQKCIPVGETVDLSALYDFPFAPENPDSGGEQTDPQVEFQLYLDITDDPNQVSQCDPPELHVAISSAVVDPNTGLVSWTVTAKNNGTGAANMSDIGLIINASSGPWLNAIQAPAGTDLVTNPGTYCPAWLYNAYASGKKCLNWVDTSGNLYTSDPTNSGNQLLIWQLGTLQPGDQRSFTISVPMANLDANGGLTAYAISPDDKFQYPDEYTAAYYYAKNHVVPGDPSSFDAGKRNNNSINADDDLWDFSGWAYTPPSPEQPTKLQVAVSEARYSRGNVTWTVTAQNGGNYVADPVSVELVIDACGPASVAAKCETTRDWWSALQPTRGNIGSPRAGVYPENSHLTWSIGKMQPGDKASVQITIPVSMVTWDGDICITAAISSPLNPYPFTVPAGQDLDWDTFKNGGLQMNNGNVNADTDQWDYNGYHPDNPTHLQVAVSPYQKVGDNVSWTITAKNGGTASADPVTVELVVDALTDAAWAQMKPTLGSVSTPGSAVYRDNERLTWTIGHMEPGQTETLVITIPISNVTWDGDICVTAAIKSPRNPYPFTIPAGGDLDAMALRNTLQMNNGSVDDDTDQWDYNGYYADNPTHLQVAVSPYRQKGNQITWTVTAKNGGTLSADPVTVALAIDARLDAAWAKMNPSLGVVSTPGSGVYRDNERLTWTIGHMEPGQTATLVISIPTSNVTWDGDMCITAAISSPKNPYPFTIPEGGDIDSRSLVDTLQWNNNSVDDDIDQWDYNGWNAPKSITPVTPGTSVPLVHMTKTGVSTTIVLLAAAAAVVGRRLTATRRAD